MVPFRYGMGDLVSHPGDVCVKQRFLGVGEHDCEVSYSSRLLKGCRAGTEMECNYRVEAD